jgi:ADP-dependent NAD(P)H-hydrate dehydratase / NAD(P)H-hydrate epimerase
MTDFAGWTEWDAAAWIAVPGPDDDKYSRGVLGVVTGSTRYPGAAVLTVEAALHTGVGMLRYLGPDRPTDLVLARRPEAVTAEGRVQAWLLGSGIDEGETEPAVIERMDAAITSGMPCVLDAGALHLRTRATGPVVLTPHAGELARLLGVDRAAIAADPPGFAVRAAAELDATVLLKGNTTHVAGPGVALSVQTAPTWLATAGAGDALAGILGALVATHADEIAADPTALARLAATAAHVHGLAAARASDGGPLTVLDLCAAVPAVIAELIRNRKAR